MFLLMYGRVSHVADCMHHDHLSWLLRGTSSQTAVTPLDNLEVGYRITGPTDFDTSDMRSAEESARVGIEAVSTDTMTRPVLLTLAWQADKGGNRAYAGP